MNLLKDRYRVKRKIRSVCFIVSDIAVKSFFFGAQRHIFAMRLGESVHRKTAVGGPNKAKHDSQPSLFHEAHNWICSQYL